MEENKEKKESENISKKAEAKIKKTGFPKMAEVEFTSSSVNTGKKTMPYLLAKKMESNGKLKIVKTNKNQ